MPHLKNDAFGQLMMLSAYATTGILLLVTYLMDRRFAQSIFIINLLFDFRRIHVYNIPKDAQKTDCNDDETTP